jgi:hypothetical protein
LFVALALVNGAGGQRHSTFPTPPAPAVSNEPASPQAKHTRRYLDTVTMEREAKELAALAASIPGDIDQIKKNLLPSDALDKLKRIEKLSKQLRSQMQP